MSERDPPPEDHHMLSPQQREQIFRLLRRLGEFDENPHLDFVLLLAPGQNPLGRADLLQAGQWIRGNEPYFKDDYLESTRDWESFPSGGVPAEPGAALRELRGVVRGTCPVEVWLAAHEPKSEAEPQQP